MELRSTWGLRPGGQAARGTAGQADAASRTAIQPARKDASADKLTLSRQALAFLDDEDREASAQESGGGEAFPELSVPAPGGGTPDTGMVE